MIKHIVLFLLFPILTSNAFIQVSDIHHIHKVHVVQSHKPRTVKHLQALVTYANDHNLSISIAGRQHTQGGQTLSHNGIFIDMTHFNKIIQIDKRNQLLRVQPGATWADILQKIKPLGLAIKTMQYFNSFTVGGSLSVNCNGYDTQASLLIDTIESLRILKADGSIVTASRTQNYDLFTSAIGGYGLFGIIIEATIKLTKDDVYLRKLKVMPTKDYLSYFLKHIKDNKNISFHNVRLNTDTDKLFENAIISTCYKPIQKQKAPNLPSFIYDIALLPVKMEFVRQFDIAKEAHFFLEKHLVSKKRYISRNEISSLSAKHIPFHGTQHLNVLEEYFVPVDQLNVFLERLKGIIKNQEVNLLYFMIRYLPQNHESLLHYTQKDCMSIVMYMTHKRTQGAHDQHAQATRSIIDLVLQLGGTYYLVSQGHATREQLKKSYPMIDTFFAKKNQYDPKGIFRSLWFEQYKA